MNQNPALVLSYRSGGLPRTTDISTFSAWWWTNRRRQVAAAEDFVVISGQSSRPLVRRARFEMMTRSEMVM